MTLLKKWLRLFLALMFIVAGVLHFVYTDAYASIIPPFLPAPVALVHVSGVFEILGGVGLLLPLPLRRWTAFGLVLLLFAVYPANIHMALNPETVPNLTIAPWLLWLRLPFQFVLMAGVLWTIHDPSVKPERLR